MFLDFLHYQAALSDESQSNIAGRRSFVDDLRANLRLSAIDSFMTGDGIALR